MLLPILTAESKSSQDYFVKIQLGHSARISGAHGEISALTFLKISSRRSESFISFVIFLAVSKNHSSV